MPYLKALGLTAGAVLVCGGTLIGLGNWLGPWWAVGGFAVLMGAGIWYWNYNEKKTRCPRQQ